jgi:hypothetical protein
MDRLIYVKWTEMYGDVANETRTEKGDHGKP